MLIIMHIMLKVRSHCRLYCSISLFLKLFFYIIIIYLCSAAQHETGRMPSSIFMLALTQKVALLSAQMATLQLQLTHQV